MGTAIAACASALSTGRVVRWVASSQRELNVVIVVLIVVIAVIAVIVAIVIVVIVVVVSVGAVSLTPSLVKRPDRLTTALLGK